MSKKATIVIGSVLIALITIGLFVWLAVDLTLPPRFEINNSKLIVKDSYRTEIDLTNAQISLSSDKLELTKRIAGTAVGSKRKGRYTIKDIETEVYLSIMRFGEEYIFIKNGDKRYYINLSTSEETLELFNKYCFELGLNC